MKGFFGPVVLLAATTTGVWGFDLQGSWHASGLDIPGTISLVRDGAGVVTDWSGDTTFEHPDGTLVIDAAGNVSGSVGGTVAGNVSVTADGQATFVLTAPDPETLVFHITSTSDLMATSVGDSNNHNLLVLAKAPTTAAAIDAEGAWWVVQLETPDQLTLQRNGAGKVTGVNGANSFRQSRRPLVISAPGRYNYNSGEEQGAVNVAPDGTVTLTPDDPQEPVHQLHMNTLKDVMISSSSSGGDGQLLVLVKTHEVRNWPSRRGPPSSAGKWSRDRQAEAVISPAPLAMAPPTSTS